MRKLLSVLLALCLVVGMLPMAALATPHKDCTNGDSCTQHEAAIDSTHYDTIGEAIDAANKTSGSDTITIKLLEDAALTSSNNQKAILRNMTLDLGGHTLVYTGLYGFVVNYNVTFKIQNGTYKNTAAEGTGIMAVKETYTGPGCTIIIAEGATVEAYDGIMTVGHTDLQVYGTIKSTKNAIFGSGPKNKVLVEGATLISASYGVYQQSRDGGSIYTINNSQITANNIAVWITNQEDNISDPEQGMQTLNVTNSIITGGDGITAEYTNVSISGENTQIKATERALEVLRRDAGMTDRKTLGNLSITGGTFTGEIHIQPDADKETSSAKLTISGGTFSSDVSAYLADGYTMVEKEDGKFVAEELNESNAVAKVGTKYYSSLAEAIGGAQSGEEVTLLQSTNDNPRITISDGKSITLNMNGHDVGFAKNGNITVTNGNLNITGTGKLYEQQPYYAPVMLYGSPEDVADYSVLTVGQDVTLEGWSGVFIDYKKPENKAYGVKVTVNGTLHSVKDTSGAGGHALYLQGMITDTTGNVPEIVLDGATLKTDDGNGMYLAGYAKTKVSNSTIISDSEGSTGIEIRAGELEISNSTITGGNGEYTGGPNGNGSTSANAALAVAQHTTKLPIKITINSGTFAGGAAFAQANPQENDETSVEKVELNIKGGTFYGEVYSEDKTEFISGGEFSESVAEYVIDKLDYEVHNGLYTYHTSLNEAMEEAGNGGTVSSVDSVTSGETANEKNVVFKNGDDIVWTVNVVENEKITLPKLPNSGYNTFVGWSDGAKSYKADETVTVTKDMTFTAQWSYNPPVVVPSDPTYTNTVSDTENGKVAVSPTSPKEDTTVTITATPDEGYKVGSVSVTDKNGKTVAVTNAGNGKYTFTQPDSKVTIKVTFVWDGPFTDVGDAWYTDAIQYVYENNLMIGTSTTTFQPELKLNRAMAAQILYNLECQPAVTGTATFTDTDDAGAWAVKAITWAEQNDVVAGIGGGLFDPTGNVTREQFAQMMYNYAKYKSYDLAKTGDLSGFEDAGKISSWAVTAMNWANGNGLINGHEDTGLIDPAGTTTRAQVASIIMNFDLNVVK